MVPQELARLGVGSIPKTKTAAKVNADSKKSP